MYFFLLWLTSAFLVLSILQLKLLAYPTSPYGRKTEQGEKETHPADPKKGRSNFDTSFQTVPGRDAHCAERCVC